jgi:hypothetical protein
MLDRPLTREELYALVWSKPMKTLASRCGLSDVGLAKICRHHAIPVPPRGYWAKLQAGKKVARQPLPRRGFGMPETIRSDRTDRWYSDGVHQNPTEIEIPPPPEFTETIPELRERARKLVTKVTVPKDLTKAHPHIARLLREDEARRQEQLASPYPSTWNAPRFGSPFEHRRLRLLNAIFVALERCGMRCALRGKDPKDSQVRVGDVHISFTLDHPGQKRDSFMPASAHNRPASDKLQLKISPDIPIQDIPGSWEDDAGGRVERHVTDIVIGLIVAGEILYRQGEISSHRWLTERKAQLVEDARRRKEEEERRALERRRKAEQARVDRLLGEAAALRQANDIRAYVSSVRSASDAAADPASKEELDAWASWALAQAERIDPVGSRRFLIGLLADSDEGRADEG